MSRLSPKPAPTVSEPPTAALAIHDMPGHLVRRLQQVAVRLFGDAVGADLTNVQFAALSAIAERSLIDQTGLAELIGYDRATIGGVVDRLEAKGLVVRSSSASDRRSKLLTATANGHALLAETLPLVRAVQERLLAPLEPQERRQFEALCRKLLAHHVG